MDSRASAKRAFPTTRAKTGASPMRCAIAQTPFHLARNGHSLPSQRTSSLFEFRASIASSYSSTAGLPPDFPPSASCPTACTVAQSRSRNRDAIPAQSKRISAAISNLQRDAFGALNTAFLEDGAYVHVRKGRRPRRAPFISVRLNRARFTDDEPSAQPDRGGRKQPGHGRRRLCLARRRPGSLQHGHRTGRRRSQPSSRTT